MTTPSLWQALDDALIDAFTTQMGAASPYTTLQLARLEVGDTWDADTWTLPALLLISNDADLTSGPHGAGAPHAQTTYTYGALTIASGTTHSEAKQAAQELHLRMINVLRTWPAIMAAARAAIAAGTEHPQRMLWNRGGIQIRGRQGANQGRHLGLAIVSFRFETSI